MTAPDLSKKETLSELKYIVITIHSKEKGSKIEQCGLFIAVRPIANKKTILAGPDDDYVWMYRDGSVRAYSLDNYYISKITVGLGASTESTYPYREHEMGWKKATKTLTEVMSERDKMLGDKTLIDPSAYDIPQKVKDHIGNKSFNVAIVDRTFTSSALPTVPHHPAACGYNNRSKGGVTTYTTSTAILHRTTKYPVKKAMEAMAKKIALLRKGKYEPPDIEEIDIEEDKVSTHQASCRCVQCIDEETESMYGMCY